MPNAQLASNYKHISQGLFLLTAGALVFVIILVVKNIVDHQPTTSGSSAASASSRSYFPIPQKQIPVNNQSFVIGARQMNASHIDVTRTCQVVGHFQAQGGSGNDVRVVITNEDGYQNLFNNHGFSSWYDSGRATAGTINVNLGAGKYYVIFDNRFSMVSNKAVILYLEETCN